MKSLIKHIAKIQAGHSFRERIEHFTDGDFRVIQIKDISTDGSLLTDKLLQTQTEDVRSDFFVQKDDVLFTTRGLNRRACFIGEELPNTIFVAQIFALREISEEVNPAYLAWFINQQQAQEYFGANSSGSHIQNIRKRDLESLPVKVPNLETQKKIVEVHNLALREKSLIGQIQTKREQVIERVLLNAVNNGEK